MLQLIKKDWMITRWVHWIGAAFGLALIPVALTMPQAIPFAAMFCQIVYAYLIFSNSHQTAFSAANNMLLNSLPVTRKQIVDARYLFALLSAVLYAAYLYLVALVMSAFGVPLLIPPLAMWLLLSAAGVIYQLMLMPVAHANSRYAVAASMLIYFAIIILPQRIGKGITGEQIAVFFTRMGKALGGWAVPALILAGVLVLGILSLSISRRIYRRAEF